MKKVREGLYIGNIRDAAAVLSAAEEEEEEEEKERPSSSPAAAVTHILSLISQEINPLDFKRPAPRDPRAAAPPPSSSPNKNCKLKQKIVPLLDIHSQNLLDHLEDCLEFIESGRNSGGVVLVHCFAGVSRSGAVVTAYLMKKEHLAMDNALESLKKSSEIVCPNDGFKQQLRMFEEMGCTVNRASSVYKKFRLATMGDAYIRGEKIDSSSYAADPGNVTNEQNSQDLGDQQAVSNQLSKVYRCKKCRRVVASEENLITHIPGAGVTSFKWRKRGAQGSGKDELTQPECTSIFVQPMQWMTPVQEGLVESKLQCIKCEARLGNFNWAGMQCSCGAWVNPAFQLHKSRIDAAAL
ncbi:unnamed protein product [Sphagnum balticum]